MKVLQLHACLGGGVINATQLRRQKRNWIVPIRQLKENYDYTSKGFIARIRSDKDEGEPLYYSLHGPGADEKPAHLFVVEETTGLVHVEGTLDREEREMYILSGVARFRNGSIAETKVDLRFVVADENDNPPVFIQTLPASVNESSPAGTLVAMVTAIDADKPNTSYSKVAYSIKKQEPSDGADFFYIDRHSGAIYVKEETLDRERQSSYVLTIKAADMDGASGGNTGTTTVNVKVLDINDNMPTLEKDEV
ncbi:hypothetical protein LDENG_00148790 [Lucifuga dentata]|nr:hypothetical protein LDENG_00148790 [Lucifuga dentata]